MIRDLLLPREPSSPGEGRVKTASFCAKSLIVPLFKTSAEDVVYSRSDEVSPS